MTTAAQALAGVKVAEFGAYAAGPHVGKLLANFGARVVHIESRRRPDGFRLEYPPFKDGIPGPDRGGCFAYYNDSKYGVTLDLHTGAGQELARRLLAWADIVIENMRPGVMRRLGLDYDAAQIAQSGRGHAFELQHGTNRAAREHPGVRLAVVVACRFLRTDRNA